MITHGIIQWIEDNSPYDLVELSKFKSLNNEETDDYCCGENYLVKWHDNKYYEATLKMTGTYEKCQTKFVKITIQTESNSKICEIETNKKRKKSPNKEPSAKRFTSQNQKSIGISSN